MTLPFARRTLSFSLVALLLAGTAIPASAQTVEKQARPAAASPAQPVASAEKPWLYQGSDIPIDKEWLFGTLPNGLRYAVRRNGVPPGQVSIRVRVGAGSLQETDNERGFAHFLEHLTFRSSKYVPDGEAKRTWQRMGATFGTDSNAQTTPTQTVFQLDLPNASREGLDESVKILSGMVREPGINQRTVNAERPVILAERRDNIGPQMRVADASYKLFFAGQPLASRTPIGTVETLQAATADALSAFHDRWYRPDTTTIVMVGDGDPQLFVQAITKYFSDWKPTAPAVNPPSFGVPTKDHPQTAVVVEPTLPTVIRYAYIRPWTEKHDTIIFNQNRLIDDLALQIINRRLEARARAGASFVQATVSREELSRSINGTFVQIMPVGDDWKKALNEVRAIIADARERPPSDADIQREFREFESAQEIAVQNETTRAASDLADEMVGAVDVHETVTTPEAALKIFRDMKPMLTPARLLQSTRDMFQGVTTRSLVTTQKENPGAEKALLAAMNMPVKPDATARLATADNKPITLPDLGKPGTIAEHQRNEALDLDTYTLSNGVKVALSLNNIEPEVVRVIVRFGKGLQAFPKDKKNALWAGQYALMASGIGNLSVNDLDRFTTGRRIEFKFDVEDDAFQFSAATRASDLEDQLHLMAAKLGVPRWDPAPVERMKAGLLASYDSLQSSPMAVLGSQLTWYLRSKDARFATPSRADIAGLTPEQFKATWAPVLASGPIEVDIFGDVDTETAIAEVAKTFGALPSRPDTPPPAANRTVSFPAHNSEPLVLTHKGDTDQAAAVMAWPTVGGLKDVKTARQLETLVALMNDRLFEKLRSADGAAYSPQSANNWSYGFPDGGYISVISQVAPDKVDFFFQFVREVAQDLATTPVSEDELRRVIEPTRELLTRVSTSNAFWLDQMKGSAIEPSRLAAVTSIGRDFVNVTPAEIQALAQKYLVPAKSWSAVVLPEKMAAAKK